MINSSITLRKPTSTNINDQSSEYSFGKIKVASTKEYLLAQADNEGGDQIISGEIRQQRISELSYGDEETGRDTNMQNTKRSMSQKRI